MSRQTILFFTLFCSLQLSAQRIDQFSTLFAIRDSNCVRISYDNDVFLENDRYYTQGVSLELFLSPFRKNPINKFLVNYKNPIQTRHGIQLFSSVYTPVSIISSNVVVGNRPFSGVLGLSFIEASSDQSKKSTCTSTIDLGIIGPYAFGKEIQTNIHKWTNNSLPIGWDTQIKNAPIINYSIRLEQQLYSNGSFFGIQGMGKMSLGTFQSNLAASIELSLGRKNEVYEKTNRRLECFLYSQSQVKVIGYDASLMGGIVNRSGYHLSYNQIAPVIAEQHVGILFTSSHFYVGFDIGFISREIKRGMTHQWGGIRLGFY